MNLIMLLERRTNKLADSRLALQKKQMFHKNAVENFKVLLIDKF